MQAVYDGRAERERRDLWLVDQGFEIGRQVIQLFPKGIEHHLCRSIEHNYGIQDGVSYAPTLCLVMGKNRLVDGMVGGSASWRAVARLRVWGGEKKFQLTANRSAI